MNNPNFSILITTKNRLSDLKETLSRLTNLIQNNTIECIICDDGSTDGTSTFIETHYKSIQLIRNPRSKGLIFSRNRLLNLTEAKYAITLDDDAHLVSQEPLEKIEQFFKTNQTCAVIAFRIFWGKTLPENLNHSLFNTRVKGFVGCGHVWRMDAWKSIPNYLDWFVFYGEEEYAGYYLFKKNWEVWFVPDILVHHRVDVKARKKDNDYQWRLRYSLRSGWYLYILFYPLSYIPKKLAYTLWMQLKLKVFKGDVKVILPILYALIDLLINFPRLLSHSDRFKKIELKKFHELSPTMIYWKP